MSEPPHTIPPNWHPPHEWDARVDPLMKRLAAIAARELPQGYWYGIIVKPLGSTGDERQTWGPGFASDDLADQKQDDSANQKQTVIRVLSDGILRDYPIIP